MFKIYVVTNLRQSKFDKCATSLYINWNSDLKKSNLHKRILHRIPKASDNFDKSKLTADNSEKNLQFSANAQNNKCVKASSCSRL